MWQRLVLAAVAAMLAVNGAHMLFAAEHWYHSLDSVPFTGAFNSHFVRDIGCAYLAAAAGMLVGAWRPQWLIPATLPAFVFLALHALVHVADALTGQESAEHSGTVDFVGVYGPPLLALVVMLSARRRGSTRNVAA